MATTKRMVASTSNDQSNNGGKGKGKRSRQNRDTKQEQSDGISVHTSGHRGLTVQAIDPQTLRIRTLTASK